ncbi:MAG TPA: ATP-binding protein [Anaeromyxobacter sp.]
MAIEDGMKVLFLRMQPLWSMVDDVRRLVASFCATACPGAEQEEQLALAAQELVQNAFAHAGASEIELRLELDRFAGRARVSVTNACDPEQIPLLRALVARVQAQPDPLAGYLEAMRANPEGRGGLGLSRIRYEGELDLGVDVRGRRVTVHAAGPLSCGAGPNAVA